jgi:hypothetical protein
MPTDITEKGLESLIMRHMTGGDGLFSGGACMVAEEVPSKPTIHDRLEACPTGRCEFRGWRR